MTTQKVASVNLQYFTNGSPQEAKDFTRQFGDSIKEFGFVIVEGHGIQPELIAANYSNVQQLFELPTAVKHKYEIPNSFGQKGYTSFGREHAKYSDKADLKEFWHVRREPDHSSQSDNATNIWPDTELPNFKPTLNRLFGELDKFSKVLLTSLSEYLGLAQNHLPDMVHNGDSVLRLLHYPPLKDDQFVSGAVRSAAHEDINFITILCEATQSGLELLTREGKWLSIETGPGQMVVDSGDMLSRICNDVIPATTHRVVNPASGKNVSRYSMPFFVHPYSTCQLSTLPTCQSALNPSKYPSCTAGEFLHQRLQEIGLK